MGSVYWFGPLQKSQFVMWHLGKINCPPVLQQDKEQQIHVFSLLTN